MCCRDLAHPTNSAVDAGGGESRQIFGRRGEDVALAHYERLGFRAVARNLHMRVGELDLIVWDGRTLIFAEVKACHRCASRLGSGGYDYASLGWPSRGQLRRGRIAARRWLSEEGNRRPRAQEIRIDVVKVWFDTDGCLVDLQQLTLG